MFGSGLSSLAQERKASKQNKSKVAPLLEAGQLLKEFKENWPRGDESLGLVLQANQLQEQLE